VNGSGNGVEGGEGFEATPFFPAETASLIQATCPMFCPEPVLASDRLLVENRAKKEVSAPVLSVVSV
jgi:hypothetical protein